MKQPINAAPDAAQIRVAIPAKIFIIVQSRMLILNLQRSFRFFAYDACVYLLCDIGTR